ncbi:MAG: hypothetical protein GX306_02325 [Clostridiales bacterium]|jgi:nitroreductase|nr:hypothetical protein [Clostridiales bacterium]
MNMYEAIFKRKSVRHYLNEKVEWDVIADILEFADSLPKFVDDVAVEFKLVSNIETKQGFRGPFSVKAPYYICISSEKGEDYLLNAGFMMQQLSLYITSKGLGTCFVGLANPGRGLKSTMKYDYVIALAFGKPAVPLYRNNMDAKRLPEEDIVVYKEDVNSNIRQLITAARLSPSGLNNQPWRFVVYKNRIHVFTRKNVLLYKMMDTSNMIDIGVMLANVLIAAEELWVDVSISKLESLKNKPFQNNQYVLTITIG